MPELARAFKKPENIKLLLREIRSGVLSEKGRVKVVLGNDESYSIDASRIKSISYIPGKGYVVDYETERPKFYEEKKSIVDPNDLMLRLAIPLRFKIKKSIEPVYFCPICGRELIEEENADDVAYKCKVYGYEWEWDDYVDTYEDLLDEDLIGSPVEPKPVKKQVERTRLEIDFPNIADVEYLVTKFADIEAKRINDIPEELASHILKSKDSKECSADFYTSINFP